jgi:CelD/BcsL family acetyltransferase involved in cellulose biosynthesis
MLAARECRLPAWRALLQALMQGSQFDELLLPGLSPDTQVSQIATECGLWTHSTERRAPYVDLDRVRASGGDYAAVLSTKGRYAVRRAFKDYRSLGEPALVRAGTAAQADQFLTELAELHQLRWNSRGQRGAFARPAFRAFHHSLIRDHFERDCLDLFRIQCGATVIALVYVFRYRGTADFYQCGFNYCALPAHNQPGYLALPMVIKHYAAAGARTFEFLAGDEAYKSRLSTHHRTMMWLEVQRPALRTALLRWYRALRGSRLGDGRATGASGAGPRSIDSQ